MLPSHLFCPFPLLGSPGCSSEPRVARDQQSWSAVRDLVIFLSDFRFTEEWPRQCSVSAQALPGFPRDSVLDPCTLVGARSASGQCCELPTLFVSPASSPFSFALLFTVRMPSVARSMPSLCRVCRGLSPGGDREVTPETFSCQPTRLPQRPSQRGPCSVLLPEPPPGSGGYCQGQSCGILAKSPEVSGSRFPQVHVQGAGLPPGGDDQFSCFKTLRPLMIFWVQNLSWDQAT